MTTVDITDRATGRSRILAEKCATCILGPAGTRIALSPARIRQFVADTVAAESYVVCHSTLHGLSDTAPAICRGFADSYDTQALLILRRLDNLVEVDPPDITKEI